MSEILATYDRDDNVTGSIQANSFVPEYGSKVSFENKNVHFYTADNNYKKFSKGVNGTKIKFNLKFSNKTEDEARSFLHLLEEVNGRALGNLTFNSTNSSGVEIAFPVGDIYKNIEETLIENYNFAFHDGLFDIDLTLSKNGYSSFFDWSSSSYLNTGNFNTGWSAGAAYEKFDIVYFPEYATGSFQNFDKFANRIEKFYYCSGDHTSSVGNSPTGANSKWTRSFYYDMDDGISIDTDRNNNIVDLENSFASFSKTSSNGGLVKDLKLTFKNRSDKETRSIIHFLEKHEDYRPFELSLPQLYTRRKFFICKSFEHTFVYKDCNDIAVTVDEVVKFKLDAMLDNYSYDN